MSEGDNDNDKEKGCCEKTREFFTTVFDQFKREEGVLPKSVIETIEKMEKEGEDVITTMQLVRTPVESYVKVLLQSVSMGKYKQAVKESDYDRMFHLSIRLNHGKYRLEKNEVISLYAAPEMLADNAEFIRVALPRGDEKNTLTIRSLLDKTREYMGPLEFTDYNAKTNNCQDFVMGVLKGNDLNTDLLEKFTLQDAEEVFGGMPEVVAAVAETMTDAAAAADNLVEQYKDDCRDFIKAVANRFSRDKSRSAGDSTSDLFIQKAQELQDQYGEEEGDIPEEEMREAMKQLHLAHPEGTKIVKKSSVSAEDKAGEVLELLGG